jgi:anti-anti-sigma factor
MSTPEPPGLDVQERTGEDGGRVLVPVGELDLASVDALSNAVERACAGRAPSLTLDLRRLDFIDSTGLAAIVLAGRLCDRNGAEFALIPGSSSIQRLFELTGLLDALPFRAASEADAG